MVLQGGIFSGSPFTPIPQAMLAALPKSSLQAETGFAPPRGGFPIGGGLPVLPPMSLETEPVPGKSPLSPVGGRSESEVLELWFLRRWAWPSATLAQRETQSPRSAFPSARGDPGAVGESGSGKSTVGQMVAGILRPTAGAAIFQGEELSFPFVGRPAGASKSCSSTRRSPSIPGFAYGTA